jgi:hypothetical protein
MHPAHLYHLVHAGIRFLEGEIHAHSMKKSKIAREKQLFLQFKKQIEEIEEQFSLQFEEFEKQAEEINTCSFWGRRKLKMLERQMEELGKQTINQIEKLEKQFENQLEDLEKQYSA